MGKSGFGESQALDCTPPSPAESAITQHRASQKELPCPPPGTVWPPALLGDTGRGGMGRAAPGGGRQEGGGSTCTCTRIESLHVAGTRRAFACIIIQSALVIIAWANPARAGVILGLLDC